MQYLSLFDCFGSTIQIRGYKGQSTQKTIIGGLTTLIVYSLSLCYFIYILVIWQAGDIGPSVAKYNDVLNYSIFQSGDESLFDFTFYISESDIDPFSEQTLILIPILIYDVAGVYSQPINLLKFKLESKFGSVLVQTKNLTLVLNNQLQGQPQQDVNIYIVDCSEQYLEANQSCASQDIIDKFKNQTNYVFFYNTIQTFNTKSKQIQSGQKKQYLAFDYQNSYTLYMQLNTAQLSVEDGLLFQNLNQQNYVDDVSSINQVTSKEFSLQNYGLPYYFCFVIRLSPLFSQVDVRYQNLGEIFAMVGSITSLLMSVGILIEYFNGYYQVNILVYKILQQYFPNKMQINKIGQIISINGLQDPAQIEKLSLLAESKMNILNIVYQISRIELFLLYKFGRTELMQANDYIIQTDQFEESQEMNTLETKKFYIEDMEVFQSHNT